MLAVAMLWVGLLFAPSLRHGFSDYDDPLYLIGNANLELGLSPAGVEWAFRANLVAPDRTAEYWMPVTLLSRLLDHSVGGRNPLAAHAQNLILHLLATALVGGVLGRIGFPSGWSLGGALLFGIHPVQVEAVCWLAARKDLLAGVFSLVSLWLYLGCASGSRPLREWGAFAAFLLAMLSKPSAVSFPLALVLLDSWRGHAFVLPRLQDLGRSLVTKTPYFLAGGLVVAVNFANQQDIGGVGGEIRAPLLWRLEEGIIGYVSYLRSLVFPVDLAVVHPVSATAPDPRHVAAAAAVLLSLTLLLWLGRKRVPGALIGWGIFVGLLLPLMGFVAFGRQSTAERYLYFALIGLILLALTATRTFVSRGALAILAGVSFPALTWISREEIKIWGTHVGHWERVLEVDPATPVAWALYGRALEVTGETQRAEFALRVAGKLRPGNAEFHLALGAFLIRMTRFWEAAAELERTVTMDLGNPRAHRELLVALEKSGQKEALRAATVRAQGVRVRIYVNLAAEQLAASNLGPAMEALRSAADALADAEAVASRALGNPARRADLLALEELLKPVTGAEAALARGLVCQLAGDFRRAAAEFATAGADARWREEARWREAVARLLAGERERAIRLIDGSAGASAQRAWQQAQTRLGVEQERPAENFTPKP